MDGMLSQDEINALLNGMDLDAGSDSSSGGSGSGEPDQNLLSDIEKDAIGEIANISMGTSATTLFTLVNQKVNITTPKVQLANWDTVMADYPAPCVFVEIQYTVGLTGSNILILNERDVKIITDLMMGGDGTNIDGELGELHLSAISEAMNQMMGSSATSLSSMMEIKIDISPPVASLVKVTELTDGRRQNPFTDDTFVQISFRMQIGDLIDSTIMQLYPVAFAKSLYEKFTHGSMMGGSEPAPSTPVPDPVPFAAAPEIPVAQAPQAAPFTAPQSPQMPNMGAMPGMGAMPQQQQQMPYPQMPYPQGMPMMPQTNVAPAQFTAFTPEMAAMIGQENIGLIMDVPLEVTVELGRTSKTIHDILDFAPGTIIELEKIAGEPIDVLVNGKFVAKGEVVVIEESFGVRITEIIKD
ncbi:MAG: flagellar motor switch phosphatase FliY [Lachnospiraceae bacterium]|nr:flagellar motor switch phosphatase FliY [Lachnospiraceae bacterium]